mgnify:CR=1 FL=1
MIIKKIEPQGFCGGVKKAIVILEKAISDKTIARPIYMLGSLIHNSHIIDEFKNKGVIMLDDNIEKEAMIDMINEGTIIISAHGVSPLIYQKAKEKNLNIIDTTCPFVKMIHDRVISNLNDKKEIIYIGNKNHPETKGVIGIDDKINLVSNKADINNLELADDNPYVTNQTTLSIYDIKEYYDLILKKYPNAFLDNKICDATTKRQDAVANQKYADLCIIVGDKKSSNTKKLYEVSKNIAKINTILIDNKNDLIDYDFKDINKINISSGASTPDYLVDEVINYLENRL